MSSDRIAASWTRVIDRFATTCIEGTSSVSGAGPLPEAGVDAAIVASDAVTENTCERVLQRSRGRRPGGRSGYGERYEHEWNGGARY